MNFSENRRMSGNSEYTQVVHRAGTCWATVGDEDKLCSTHLGFAEAGAPAFAVLVPSMS